MNSLKKRTAPAPPPVSIPQQPLYGTLPHAPRHYDNSDGGRSNNSTFKPGQTESYSTLPHIRNSGGDGSLIIGHNYVENKVYDRYEPSNLLSAHGKQKDSGKELLTTFGHRRSPSSESGRNINLAGAKLVLPPAGEIPQLKPVDKSIASRPRLPPPGPPHNNGSGSGKIKY